MNKIKVGITITAFLCAGMAKASVNYTNNSDSNQTVTILEEQNHTYYGFGGWTWSNFFTLDLAPGETIQYDDSSGSEGDNSDYTDTFSVFDVAATD